MLNKVISGERKATAGLQHDKQDVFKQGSMFQHTDGNKDIQMTTFVWAF